VKSFVRLKPDVEWQKVDDEVVVLDLGQSVYLGVNDSGAVLWPMVAAGTSQDRLVDELTSRFGIDDDRARADVAAFVDRLRSLSLVVEDQ
jgi:hypothetical protein